MTSILHGERALSISSDELHAAFSPSMGGRLLRFRQINGPDLFVPMEPHAFAATEWPRGGAYPLIPYHNRLADARIIVHDQIIQLPGHPASLPHTLHGPSHTRRWEHVLHTASRLVMKLEYDPDEQWPWRFEAIQDFQLDANVLKLTMSIKNLDANAMPGGLGWHPYFASNEQVSTDASYLWPHARDYLPFGNRVEITDRQSTEVLPTQYLQQWHEAQVVCSQGYQARLRATPEFQCLVIHRGHPTHICVEPVTHVANAWNLPAASVVTGARLLAPAETLGGSIEITIIR